jgi:hypothetical protein
VGEHLEVGHPIEIGLGHLGQGLEGLGPLLVVLGQLVVGREAGADVDQLLLGDLVCVDQPLDAGHRLAVDRVGLERAQVGGHAPEGLPRTFSSRRPRLRRMAARSSSEHSST